MPVRNRLLRLLPATLALLPAAPLSVFAQQGGAALGGLVELELRGRIERVFASEDRADGTRLVEILLQAVALADAGAEIPQVHIPAPGEVVFVVVNNSRANSPQQRAEAGALPHVGDVIRATVRNAGRGVWSAASADWFESVDVRRLPLDRDSPRPGGAASTPRIDLRGMTCLAKIADGRLGFEVVEVAANGPAHDAGFQVGDVIVAAGGAPIPSVASIRRLAQQSTPLKLTVVDVNTGQLADVTLAASTTIEPSRPTPADEADSSAAARIAIALGITVENARVGFAGAVKVASVDPAKRGAEGGLEVGDVIVAVDDHRVSNVDDFASAIPSGGGKITLKVRDVRSGKEVPIQVQSESVRSVADEVASPADEPVPPAGGSGRLGLSTELTFYEAEAAVKVVAVDRDSPASRAGVRPGWIIVRANDAPILHPDDLSKAEKAAAGRLALVVIDPTDGRPRTITIQL